MPRFPQFTAFQGIPGWIYPGFTPCSTLLVQAGGGWRDPLIHIPRWNSTQIKMRDELPAPFPYGKQGKRDVRRCLNQVPSWWDHPGILTLHHRQREEQPPSDEAQHHQDIEDGHGCVPAAPSPSTLGLCSWKESGWNPSFPGLDRADASGMG